MVRFARLPLSPYQRDIWVAAAQFPELDQYTIFSYDRFTGEVDTQALERALLQAARDTEAFRLRLGETDGTPYQWLDADAEFEARHVDLRADRDPEAAVRSWLRDAFRHAYPLDGRSLVTWPCCIATRRSTSTCAPTISSATPGACSYSSAGCAPATWAS